MSIFDVGFIMWGFFALYLVFILAYYIWMHGQNKKDRLAQAVRPADGGERS